MALVVPRCQGRNQTFTSCLEVLLGLPGTSVTTESDGGGANVMMRRSSLASKPRPAGDPWSALTTAAVRRVSEAAGAGRLGAPVVVLALNVYVRPLVGGI